MLIYKTAIASTLLLLLGSTATAKDTSKLKLRDTVKKSNQSFLSHLTSYFQQESTFTPAITLTEFANVDASKFKWVDRSEIAAGRSTCGFLKAPLGALPDVVYPTVKVYVCVRFAKNQPAPRGNLAVHCGGPGTLSSCVHDWDMDIGQDNIDNYNIIGFDQRGMGRSLPSFANEDCSLIKHDPNDFSIIKAVEFDQPETIRAGAQVWKDRSLACWNHPAFKLTVDKGQGVKKTFHFLEYSGTRQLVEDIERVRQVFGDQKLSIYGLSYGTKVMGLYATMFPANVNLMILDSNMYPGVDIEQFAFDSTRARNHRFEYFISACERNPTLCPVPNMRKCIAEMNDLIKVNAKDFSDHLKQILEDTTPGYMSHSSMIKILINGLYSQFDKTPPLCDSAAAGDYSTFKEILTPPPNDISSFADSSALSTQIVEDTISTPTRGYSDEWPFANYYTLSETGKSVLLTVASQDHAFGAYDEDAYVDFLFELNKKYSGAGTQSPITQAYYWYSACYHASAVTPTPPLGNSWLGGIIVGQIYDPQTAYIWTQNMRENFPSSHLLTSRSVNHGLVTAKETTTLDPTCQLNVVDYLTTGVIGFVDGTVCEGDKISDSCTIEQAVDSASCG